MLKMAAGVLGGPEKKDGRLRVVTPAEALATVSADGRSERYVQLFHHRQLSSGTLSLGELPPNGIKATANVGLKRSPQTFRRGLANETARAPGFRRCSINLGTLTTANPLRITWWVAIHSTELVLGFTTAW